MLYLAQLTVAIPHTIAQANPLLSEEERTSLLVEMTDGKGLAATLAHLQDTGSRARE